VQTIFVEWLESVRKDIQCVFGHLKQRLRRLQNANQSHDLMDVEYCFKTCCALHSMLLRYNGHGKINNWENYDPEGLKEENYEANREEYILSSSISNPHNVAYEDVIPTEPRRQIPITTRVCDETLYLTRVWTNLLASQLQIKTEIDHEYSSSNSCSHCCYCCSKEQ